MNYKKYVMEDALEALIDYRGKTPKKSESGVLTLSAKSVKNNYIDYSLAYYISEEEYKKFMVRGFPRRGDILLTTEAPLGNVARLDRDNVAIAQRLLTLRGKEGIIDNNYLLYYLQSDYGQFLLRSKETGTTVTGIKQSEFRKIELLIPPFEEQKRISNIIESVDIKKEINDSIIKNLIEQIETIYGLLLEKESDKWISLPLSKLVAVNKRGLTPSYVEDGIPVINQRCLRNKIIIDEAVQYHDEKVKYDEECVYKPYDVLINSMGVGTLGRISQVGELKEKRLIHSCITILRANKNYNQFILGAHLKHIQKEIENMGEGTTGQTSLSNKELGKITVPVPPVETQKQYGAFFRSIIDEITELINENETLQRTRDLLLFKLISNEIDEQKRNWSNI